MIWKMNIVFEFFMSCIFFRLIFSFLSDFLCYRFMIFYYNSFFGVLDKIFEV